MIRDKKTLVRTTEEHVLKLNHKDILTLLAAGAGVDVPYNADVIVHTPGGGDWSNMDLDVDDSCPVTIRWRTQTYEGSLV